MVSGEAGLKLELGTENAFLPLIRFKVHRISIYRKSIDRSGSKLSYLDFTSRLYWKRKRSITALTSLAF
jgi:hypothetical protein